MKNRQTLPIFLLTSGAVASLAFSLLPSSPAISATLDGFEINTNDDAVKIILHTDERAAYATEQNDQQFSIILKNTKLSQKQLDAGLPVVVDNRNQFIGRAVPAGKDIVKITVPNLPTSQYAISVLQQRQASAAVEKAPEKKLAATQPQPKGASPAKVPSPKAIPSKLNTQEAEKALEALVNDKKPTTVANTTSTPAPRSAIQKANLKKTTAETKPGEPQKAKENLAEAEKLASKETSTKAVSLFPNKKTPDTEAVLMSSTALDNGDSTEKPAPKKLAAPKKQAVNTLPKSKATTTPIEKTPLATPVATPPAEISSPEFISVPLPEGPSPKDIAAQAESDNQSPLFPFTQHPFLRSAVFQGLLGVAFIFLGIPVVLFLLRSVFGIFRPKQRLIYKTALDSEYLPENYLPENYLNEERERQRAIQQQLATPQWVEDEDVLDTEAGNIDWIERAKRVSFMDQTRVVSSPYLLRAPKTLREAVLNTQRLRYQPTRRKAM